MTLHHIESESVPSGCTVQLAFQRVRPKMILVDTVILGGLGVRNMRFARSGPGGMAISPAPGGTQYCCGQRHVDPPIAPAVRNRDSRFSDLMLGASQFLPLSI